MTRTTVSLPEELLERVRIRAAERGVSMATLIREAVEEKVSRTRPKPRTLGLGASGHTDTSTNHEHLLTPRSWRS
jgi:metal-responsive CopG/Arc/MetJ family transcriptional regulator